MSGAEEDLEDFVVAENFLRPMNRVYLSFSGEICGTKARCQLLVYQFAVQM